MRPFELVVIGEGAAGAAAAFTGSRLGARVLVIADRPGATELYSGALDLEPWERPGYAIVDPDVLAFADALGIWSLENSWRRVVTASGVPRLARGMDSALLDLEPLAGAHIAVADSVRGDLPARVVVRALEASTWARATGTRFSLVGIDLLRSRLERRFPLHDFAQLHDAPDRAEWLGQQLAQASARYDAWLLGPWLGVSSDAAARVRLALMRPVGEITSPPGGPAGARFAAARDRLFAALRVQRLSGRALSVEETARGLEVAVCVDEAPHPHGAATTFGADAVVLAIGGLVGGGVELREPALAIHAAFAASLQAPVTLELDGRDVPGAASLYGVDLVHGGVGMLERVGIAADGERARGTRRLYVAGECVAGRHRTVLEAVRAGASAARLALAAGS